MTQDQRGLSGRRRQQCAPERRVGFFERLEHRDLLNADPVTGSILPGPPRDLAVTGSLQVESRPSAAASNAGVVGEDRAFASAAQLEDFLVNQAMDRWFGDGPVYQPWIIWNEVFQRPILTLDTQVFTTAVDSLSAGNTASFSKTNVQEAGVDEADIVKSDGESIFFASGQSLFIIDAVPADSASVIERVDLSVFPHEMYLHGDRLTLISSAPTGTAVTVYDVSDRRNPTVIQETTLEGQYVESRSIDNFVYVIVRDYDVLPVPIFDPVTGSFAETEEAYGQRVREEFRQSGVTDFTSRSFGPGGVTERSGPLADATSVVRSIVPNHSQVLSVAVFDVLSDVPGPVGSVSIMGGDASVVYASQESLYIVSPHQFFGILAETSSGFETEILKFNLDGADIELAARGTIEGFILNQFSLDENGPYLRIATTTGWGDDAKNHLFILAEQGDELTVVGKIEDLAPGERIYSARFFDDRAYVVTFRQVDPLFAIDLSDPTNPTVEGELKITGFSDYLHPIGDNHLLGFGRNATLTGLFQELQLTLFDVSNLTNPTVVDQYSFEAGRNADSLARRDHHAINYDVETRTLALPFDVYGSQIWIDTNADGVDDTEVPYDGPQHQLRVFEIDTATGFEVMGSVEHEQDVLRNLRIDDLLFSISTDSVKAHKFTDLENPVAFIELEDAPGGMSADWWEGELPGAEPPVLPDGSLELSWAEVNGAECYQIYLRNRATGEEPYRYTQVEGTTFSPGDGIDAGEYEFWVRAVAEDGSTTEWSQAKEFVVTAASSGSLDAEIDFTGNAPLLNNWVERAGSFSRSSAGLAPAAENMLALATLDGVQEPKLSVAADVDVSAAGFRHVGLVARHAGAGDENMYLGALVNTGSEFAAQIWANADGNWTLLKSVAVDHGAGALRFDLDGNAHELFLDGQLVVHVDASNPATHEAPAGVFSAAPAIGSTGIRSYGAIVRHFRATSLPGDAAIPVDLLAPVDTSQVPLRLTHVPQTEDVVVEADVSLLPGSGIHHVGLVARASMSGDESMYLGAITNYNGHLAAEIWRNLDGEWTNLKSVSANRGEGTLRFELIDETLRLYLDDELVVLANDSAVRGAGRTGVRTDAGGFDHFRTG